MKKFFEKFSLLGILMLVACVLLGVGDITGAVYANGTFTQVNSSDATEGKVASQAADGGALEQSDVRTNMPDLVLDPVDQNLVKIRPTSTPLDTILRYAGTMKTNNMEYEWYSIGTRAVDDELDGAATITSNTDKLQVKAVITVAGNLNKFDETDTIIFPSINGGDSKPLVGYVYKKDEANNQLYFTVLESQMTSSTTSGTTTYSIPAIADETKFYALSRAAGELDVKTPALSYLPAPTRGYCQIFMAQVAQSTIEKMMDKKLNYDLPEIEEQALYEWRKRMEGSFLFGRGGKVYDPTRKRYVYMTDGIVHQITNSYSLNTSATDGDKELISLEKKIFTGNSGSKVRYIFAGSEWMEMVSNISTIKKQLEAGNTEFAFGLKWNKIESNFGTLNLMHHELFNEYGWTAKAIVIDPQFLKKWQLANFSRTVYDGKALAQMNGEFVVFQEIASVAVYNPAAHAIITLTTSEA